MQLADIMFIPTSEMLRLMSGWLVGVLVIVTLMTFVDLFNHRGEHR